MPHRYGAEQIAWISERRNMPRGEIRDLFNVEFGASVTLHSINRVCSKHRLLSDTPNPLIARERPHNYRGAGAEQLHPDGYMRLCVDQDGGTQWVLKHVHLWEQANGPVPEGHRLVCRGDTMDCDPANWECMPHGVTTQLFLKSKLRYAQSPVELRPTLVAIAQLKHAKQRGKLKT